MRKSLSSLGIVMLALWAACCIAPSVAFAQSPPLILEKVEIEGNTRTGLETVLFYLPLTEGDPVDPYAILDAVESLRASDLFSSVESHTRPGSKRGRIVLVLTVKEKGVEFRVGTGYQDLDGWYLIPAQLRFDNRLGRGERTKLQFLLGYRLTGFEFLFDEPHFGDGLNFWGAGASALFVERVYFVDGIEFGHQVDWSSIDASLGRRLGTSWKLEGGARYEVVDAADQAEARASDDFRDISQGDPIQAADLPPAISDWVGENRRSVFHGQLVYDSRSRSRIASTPSRGVWGRLRADAYLQQGPDIGSVIGELRAYRPVLGGVTALRLRGGAIGNPAPFYDRFYLGGLYTIRGFPSHALSPPEGDTRFWTASLEFRGALVGAANHPRLAGFLFVDAGHGWIGTSFEPDDTAAGAGFGLRLRVPWIQSVGLDFGIPITDSPVGESFHINGALQWNF